MPFCLITYTDFVSSQDLGLFLECLCEYINHLTQVKIDMFILDFRKHFLYAFALQDLMIQKQGWPRLKKKKILRKR